MIRAVFPGTFDPPTKGHLNLIKRAGLIFDKLDVVIADNSAKQDFFTPGERAVMLKEMVKDLPNVEVHVWDRLIVEFVKEFEAKVIIRGIRALTDFGYEFELAMTNKSLDPDVEIVFMPTDPKYFVIRSSIVKEVYRLNGDVHKMVPEVVLKALKSKLRDA